MVWPLNVKNIVFLLAIEATLIDHAHCALFFLLMRTISLGKRRQQHNSSMVHMQRGVGYVIYSALVYFMIKTIALFESQNSK